MKQHFFLFGVVFVECFDALSFSHDSAHVRHGAIRLVVGPFRVTVFCSLKPEGHFVSDNDLTYFMMMNISTTAHQNKIRCGRV